MNNTVDVDNILSGDVAKEQHSDDNKMLEALNGIQRQTTKSPGNSNHIKSRTNIMDDDNNNETNISGDVARKQQSDDNNNVTLSV